MKRDSLLAPGDGLKRHRIGDDGKNALYKLEMTIPSREICKSSAANIENDFANMGVAFHQSMGFGSVREWKSSEHDGLDRF